MSSTGQPFKATDLSCRLPPPPLSQCRITVIEGLTTPPITMLLTNEDQKMLSGGRGDGALLAMQMIVRVGEAFDAKRLIDISWAHVASAYDHSKANLDFAQRLAKSETRVVVPTTLTACSLNLNDDSATNNGAAQQIIELYKAMGCKAVMTCAPYHTRSEPGFGEHVAWCESSAVVYANSVLGARTNRYVEFLDMCAAVTGRVPECGLHITENRRATVLFKLQGIPDKWLRQDWFFHALGILLGQRSSDAVPAIEGLPVSTKPDLLRALGAAAASSGSVSMFHAIGITPEAVNLKDAFHNRAPEFVEVVTPDDIRVAANDLSRGSSEPLTAVCLGAPHFSREEFDELVRLLDGRRVAAAVKMHVATSGAVLEDLARSGRAAELDKAGVSIVTGRCTYYKPVIDGCDGHVMTNSAKWAWYAPTGLGAAVTFASLATCVESACAGCAVDDSEF
jgi:predicted aconitase